MLKGIFLGYPIMSHIHPIKPIIEQLVSKDLHITYYNSSQENNVFEGNKFIDFIQYKNYSGYEIKNLRKDIRFFEFGNLLLDTTENIIDFVDKEIKRIKPDFIIHPKFAIWAKLLAHKYNIPALTISVSLVLNPKNTFTYSEQVEKSNSNYLRNLIEGKKLIDRVNRIYNTNGYSDHYSDIFVNKEKLNIILTLKEFQNDYDQMGDEFIFVGPIIKKTAFIKSYKYIYISLGSVFNDDLEFYKQCIDAVKDFGKEVIVSIGNKLSLNDFFDVPKHVKIYKYVDQIEVLKETALFITHGGGNSINEGIYYLTPMTVVPQIAEQKIFAEAIENFELGFYIQRNCITAQGVKDKATKLLNDPKYFNNLIKFQENLPEDPVNLAIGHLKKSLNI